jgi:hypothetical protein
MKASEIAKAPVAKVILADFPWYDRDTRSIYNPASAWHNDRGKPVFPTLFGDGHVANFLFPLDPSKLSVDVTTNGFW